MNLEQSILNSIDSFSDRIVLTETLIIEEAEQIVEMVERIVKTEEIVIGMIESCSCENVSATANNSLQIPNPTKSSKAGHQDLLSTQANELFSARYELGDACSAMDQIIKVMDECINAFQTFNDDFLEVLLYMVDHTLILLFSYCFFSNIVRRHRRYGRPHCGH